MATRKKKTAARKAVTHGIRSNVSQPQQSTRKGRGTITPQQHAAVMRNLEDWLAGKSHGEKLSGHRKAEMLGISQAEWNDWENDKQRPGLPRLIHLFQTTKIPLEVMLGLNKS